MHVVVVDACVVVVVVVVDMVVEVVVVVVCMHAPSTQKVPCGQDKVHMSGVLTDPHVHSLTEKFSLHESL